MKLHYTFIIGAGFSEIDFKSLIYKRTHIG